MHETSDRTLGRVFLLHWHYVRTWNVQQEIHVPSPPCTRAVDVASLEDENFLIPKRFLKICQDRGAGRLEDQRRRFIRMGPAPDKRLVSRLHWPTVGPRPRPCMGHVAAAVRIGGRRLSFDCVNIDSHDFLLTVSMDICADGVDPMMAQNRPGLDGPGIYPPPATIHLQRWLRRRIIDSYILLDQKRIG